MKMTFKERLLQNYRDFPFTLPIDETAEMLGLSVEHFKKGLQLGNFKEFTEVFEIVQYQFSYTIYTQRFLAFITAMDLKK